MGCFANLISLHAPRRQIMGLCQSGGQIVNLHQEMDTEILFEKAVFIVLLGLCLSVAWWMLTRTKLIPSILAKRITQKSSILELLVLLVLIHIIVLHLRASSFT